MVLGTSRSPAPQTRRVGATTFPPPTWRLRQRRGARLGGCSPARPVRRQRRVSPGSSGGRGSSDAINGHPNVIVERRGVIPGGAIRTSRRTSSGRAAATRSATSAPNEWPTSQPGPRPGKRFKLLDDPGGEIGRLQPPAASRADRPGPPLPSLAVTGAHQAEEPANPWIQTSATGDCCSDGRGAPESSSLGVEAAHVGLCLPASKTPYPHPRAPRIVNLRADDGREIDALRFAVRLMLG